MKFLIIVKDVEGSCGALTFFQLESEKLKKIELKSMLREAPVIIKAPLVSLELQKCTHITQVPPKYLLPKNSHKM